MSHEYSQVSCPLSEMAHLLDKVSDPTLSVTLNGPTGSGPLRGPLGLFLNPPFPPRRPMPALIVMHNPLFPQVLLLMCCPWCPTVVQTYQLSTYVFLCTSTSFARAYLDIDTVTFVSDLHHHQEIWYTTSRDHEI